MAFRDMTVVLYDGKIKLDYKDKAHRYYARPRIDFDREVTDKLAWGKIMYPKGTTTLIGDTLEKKGLMQWPKNVALRELFGYYGEFENDQGEKVPAGFSKDVGTLWDDGKTLSVDAETLLPIVTSAAKGWQRKQKKGADIGSVVHDAIEHFVNGIDFDIAENYSWMIKESEYDSEALREKAMEEFEVDVAEAKQAFLQFQKWWYTTTPKLYSAEQLLYSMEHNVCGTYDADLGIPLKHHPKPEMFEGKEFVRCTTDWKTSNTHKEAPEGISYDYFLQDAIYELMRREMGMEPADDLLVVSARKTGEFSLIYASELGLTIDDCLDWARAVIYCFRIAARTKDGLIKHAEEPGINSDKEDF